MINGERVLVFKPRVGLSKAFEARVPVIVTWQKDQNNEVVLNLSCENEGGEMEEVKQLPVHIILPNRQEEVLGALSTKQ